MFKCGDIVYEYTCQEVTCEAAREQRLFQGYIPIHPVKKYNYKSVRNYMLNASTAKEPCTFLKVSEGEKELDLRWSQGIVDSSATVRANEGYQP